MEAMAIPIKPGKLDSWKSWCADADRTPQGGVRRHEPAARADHPRVVAPGEPADGSDLAVVVIDGPGAETFLGKMATSENAFDQWFRTSIEDVHPMDFSAPPPPMPVRQL